MLITDYCTKNFRSFVNSNSKNPGNIKFKDYNLALYTLWNKSDPQKKRKIENEFIKVNMSFLQKVCSSYKGNDASGSDLFDGFATESLRKALNSFDKTRDYAFLTWWAYKIHGVITYWTVYGFKDTYFRNLKRVHSRFCTDCKLNMTTCQDCVHSVKKLCETNEYRFVPEKPEPNNFEIMDLLNKSNLSDIEKGVIKGVIIDGFTLHEYGLRIGVAGEWVRQIKVEALKKLKSFLKRTNTFDNKLYA